MCVFLCPRLTKCLSQVPSAFQGPLPADKMRSCDQEGGLVSWWPGPRGIWFWCESCSAYVGRMLSLLCPGFPPGHRLGTESTQPANYPCRNFQSFYFWKLPVVTDFLLSLPDVVTKYSNFVSFPLYLNGKRINTLQVRPQLLKGSGSYGGQLVHFGARWAEIGLDDVRIPGQGVLCGEARSMMQTRSHPHLIPVHQL